MKKDLIKPFTITTLGTVAGFIIGRIFKAQDEKKKREMINSELERIHKMQQKEFEKNGNISEATMNALNNLTKTLIK